MKLLALSINGQQIALPGSVKTSTDFGSIMQNFITILFIIVTLLALFFMLWNGIQWMTSGGDEEKIKKARAAITYTLAGMAIAFFAFLIINIIQGFFRVPLLSH